MMKNISVFCGSSIGRRESYRVAAERLGRCIARNGDVIVYGGASVGLMRVLADAALAEGGRVIGFMPEAIDKFEVTYNDITELHIVGSMAERKQKMVEMSDSFIAMPGGMGTLDELFEVAVLSQLRIIDKPVALYNIDGYYDKLLDFIDSAVDDGFIRSEHRANIVVDDDPERLLGKLDAYKPVEVGKWIDHIKKETGK